MKYGEIERNGKKFRKTGGSSGSDEMGKIVVKVVCCSLLYVPHKMMVVQFDVIVYEKLNSTQSQDTPKQNFKIICVYSYSHSYIHLNKS